MSLNVAKFSQSRVATSQLLAQPSAGGTGGGNTGPANSLLLDVAGPIRGDSGVSNFNSTCQAAIDSNTANIGQLFISQGKALLPSWESDFARFSNPVVFTAQPDPEQGGALTRRNVNNQLTNFMDPENFAVFHPVDMTLGGRNLATQAVWTGLFKSGTNFGNTCNSWQDPLATGTFGWIGGLNEKRLYDSNESCAREFYIYCVGW